MATRAPPYDARPGAQRGTTRPRSRTTHGDRLGADGCLSGRASEEVLNEAGYAHFCDRLCWSWSRRPAIPVSARSMPERAPDGFPPYALGWSRNRQPLGVWPRLLLSVIAIQGSNSVNPISRRRYPSDKGCVTESQVGMTATIHVRLRPNYVQIQGCCTATRPRE